MLLSTWEQKLLEWIVFPEERCVNDVLRVVTKSIALDLKSNDGKEVVLKLCESADAIFEGFRPGVTERLGIGR